MIKTNWHQIELHTFVFTCDLSWLETLHWARFLLEKGNLLNVKYFTWNTEGFDELLAKQASFPHPTERHPTLSPAPWAWLRSSHLCQEITACCWSLGAQKPRRNSVTSSYPASPARRASHLNSSPLKRDAGRPPSCSPFCIQWKHISTSAA